ncbi:MAG: Xaa-Pro aminopeptidase [Gammaproteobacteria bacterium]|nr:Xaa-Pro aminopeptidase [Gammaproteobacteria bacterium]
MIQASEFARRRRALLKAIGDGVMIVPTGPVRRRNSDVEYPYRSDSDFYYLSGFPEPEAVLVLCPGRAHGQYILFCRERDAEKEAWNGDRAGLEGAVERYGADDAFPVTDIDDIMPGLMENRSKLYYSMGRHSEFDRRVLGWVNQLRGQARSGVHVPGEFVDPGHLIHDMRLIKSAAERRIMAAAARLSCKAHIAAMEICQPGMWEYQIEAQLLSSFMAGGSRSPAYPSIVGGGQNGCVLHYGSNNAQLQDGDLLLIDAGAELENYAADITRTFPVNGHYSDPQKALYEVVLAAQAAAIEQVRPGNHWNNPHEAAVRVLTEGLVDLGLLQGEVSELIETEAYRPFYMHRTGHWLGMDVHDVGDYKIDDAWRLLEPGMVLTVEPGLYIRAGTGGVDERWWNIGIRIEDDVVVTKTGHKVLTDGVPKSVAEIERVMSGRP